MENEKIMVCTTDEQKIKKDFDYFDGLCRAVIKREANSFYPSLPDYRQINRLRMEELKKLSLKYQVDMPRCLEIVNWEQFEKEVEDADKCNEEMKRQNSTFPLHELEGIDIESMVQSCKAYQDEVKKGLESIGIPKDYFDNLVRKS